MKTTSFIFFFLLIIMSCRNQKTVKNHDILEIKPYPHVINVKEGLENNCILELSDIADSIKYVVLSKEKNVLIGRFLYLQMSDNDLFIQLGTTIQRFDVSGKFLNTIGQIGKGPEEYLEGSTFSINPNSKKVYVYRNYKRDFISYDYSGSYLDKVPLRLTNDIGSFICLSDSEFAIFPVYYGVTPEDMFLCGVFDQNSNRKIAIKHPAKNTPSDFNSSRFIVGGPWELNTFFNNEIVSMCDFDTVYKINNDSIYPAFIFNWGQLPRSKTFEEKYYIAGSPKNSIANPRKIFETYLKTIFVLYDKINYYLIEYDKITGLSRSMVFPKKNDIGFKNDLDGGMPFFPEWTNRKGNTWIQLVDAIDFINGHSEDSISSSKTFQPQMRASLKTFINDLEIDDNPVLKIVYLKKQYVK